MLLLQDIARLHHACGGCHIAPVLDTQIGHALLQLAHLSGASGSSSSSSSTYATGGGGSGMLGSSASVRRIGLSSLLQIYGFSGAAHKDEMHALRIKDPK